MRVGLLCSTPMPPEEGISTYVAHLAAGLRRLGCEPLILTRGRGLRPRDLNGAGGGVHAIGLPYVPLHPLHVRAQEALCRKVWAPLKLDVVHAHLPYPPRPPRDLPLVATVHTSMRVDASHIPERTARAALQRLQSRAVAGHEAAYLRQADVVTAIAGHVADDLRRQGHAREVRVLGNAVAAEEFEALPAPAEADGPYVLYAGRLGFRKGLPTLLDAFARLDAPGVSLLLTGRGELRPALERQARALGLQERVRFLGVVPRPELLRLWAGAAAVAVPSSYEGQPTALLEAMAAGAPVVASRIPGVEEVVEHERTGLLVPPGEPDALAAALDRLLADPREARHLGRAARHRVLASHTWSASAKQYLALYEESRSLHG